jgi:Protein of unknown function (DUF3891)
VLIRPDGDGSLAIGQLSHAWLAGQLARAWGNDRFGEVEPREEIVLGAQQHDIGWASVDLEPRFNPQTGLPQNFLELTARQHLAIWRGAPDRLMSQSAHAALVVSLHGSSLSELRSRTKPEDAPVLRPHIDEEHARQARLCVTLDVSEAQRERTRRQMWTWDALSLALCNAWRPFIVRDVPTDTALTTLELIDREDGTSTLEPWPFSSERVEVHCEAKRLGSKYGDEATMRRDFALAGLAKLKFTLSA